MKKNFIKYLLIFFLILTFNAHSAEDLNEFTDSLGDVQKQFQELAAGNTEEAKIIDEAIKEISYKKEYLEEKYKEDMDKVEKLILPLLYNLMQNVVPYLRNHSRSNLPSFRACSRYSIKHERYFVD